MVTGCVVKRVLKYGRACYWYQEKELGSTQLFSVYLDPGCPIAFQFPSLTEDLSDKDIELQTGDKETAHDQQLRSSLSENIARLGKAYL